MGVLVNVPNSSCLEHLRFSYVYGFALFPFSWLSSALGFTEFSWTFGETALWSHRAAREIGQIFIWVFATTPHAGWHTCGEDFSFRVGLLSFFGEDGLPSHLHQKMKASLPLSPSHMDMPFSSQVCHPLRSYIYSRSFGILFFCFYIFLFFYFLICLYKYIVL